MGSDALKFGANELAEHLKYLFKGFLIHGHVSKIFAFCVLIPLIKNNKNSKSCSNNYRLIAISSLIMKLLDHIILHLFKYSFLSNNLQFGFQKNLSTTLCTWTMIECINYFTNRGGPIYSCLLDLTKAFDHVRHSLLFKKLRGKIPDIFLRLIIVSYMSQSCCVRFNNVDSDSFSVVNGVRQGAVASPVYFNVYLDDLFTLMKSSG